MVSQVGCGVFGKVKVVVGEREDSQGGLFSLSLYVVLLGMWVKWDARMVVRYLEIELACLRSMNCAAMKTYK